MNGKKNSYLKKIYALLRVWVNNQGLYIGLGPNLRLNIRHLWTYLLPFSKREFTFMQNESYYLVNF